MQADMVLEKELRALHPDPQATEKDCATLSIAGASKNSQPVCRAAHECLVAVPIETTTLHSLAPMDL